MAGPSSLIKNLRKKTGSVSFTESKWGAPSHYISTGDYGVNQIISGSVFKGIPAGRVSVFAGESMSLKTIQVIRIAAEALNKHKYDTVYYFDSEGGGGAETFKSFGCDLDKIEHILVETTEDAAIKMITVLKAIEEYQKKEDPNYKACIILDSLGNLENDKTFKDIEKDRLAADQGAAAKVKNKLCRAMTIPALKTDVPIMIINWVYDGPSMYTQKIKDQPGGKGAQFVGCVNVQCAKLLEKSENTDEGGYYENSLITMFTVKNRLVTPYLSTKVHVSFTEGFNMFPFLSLFDSAVELGFITRESSQSYTVKAWKDDLLRQIDEYSIQFEKANGKSPSNASLKEKFGDPDRMLKKKDLVGGKFADEIWATFLEDYDKAAMKRIAYSKVTKEGIEELGFTTEEAQDLIKKIDSDEDEPETIKE